MGLETPDSPLKGEYDPSKQFQCGCGGVSTQFNCCRKAERWVLIAMNEDSRTLDVKVEEI